MAAGAAAPPGGAPGGGGRGGRRGGGGGGGPKDNIQLYVSGTRKNLMVRIVYFVRGVGQSGDIVLNFGDESDPVAYEFPDPASPPPPDPYKVVIVDGFGTRTGVDLSGYPQFKKVGFMLADGRIFHKDIPEGVASVPGSPAPAPAGSSPKLTSIILGQPQMMTANPKDCPRPYRISVRVVDDKGKGMGNQQLEWICGRQSSIITTEDAAGREGFAEINISLNHDDVTPDKRPLTLEVRSLNFGDKVATVALTAPPKPAPPMKWWEHILEGMFGGGESH